MDLFWSWTCGPSRGVPLYHLDVAIIARKLKKTKWGLRTDAIQNQDTNVALLLSQSSHADTTEWFSVSLAGSVRHAISSFSVCNHRRISLAPVLGLVLSSLINLLLLYPPLQLLLFILQLQLTIIYVENDNVNLPFSLVHSFEISFNSF